MVVLAVTEMLMVCPLEYGVPAVTVPVVVSVTVPSLLVSVAALAIPANANVIGRAMATIVAPYVRTHLIDFRIRHSSFGRGLGLLVDLER